MENFEALKTLRINESPTLEPGYICPRGLTSPISSDTHQHQVVEILKETSTKMYTPF